VVAAGHEVVRRCCAWLPAAHSYSSATCANWCGVKGWQRNSRTTICLMVSSPSISKAWARDTPRENQQSPPKDTSQCAPDLQHRICLAAFAPSHLPDPQHRHLTRQPSSRNCCLVRCSLLYGAPLACQHFRIPEETMSIAELWWRASGKRKGLLLASLAVIPGRSPRRGEQPSTRAFEQSCQGQLRSMYCSKLGLPGKSNNRSTVGCWFRLPCRGARRGHNHPQFPQPWAGD